MLDTDKCNVSRNRSHISKISQPYDSQCFKICALSKDPRCTVLFYAIARFQGSKSLCKGPRGKVKEVKGES